MYQNAPSRMGPINLNFKYFPGLLHGPNPPPPPLPSPLAFLLPITLELGPLDTDRESGERCKLPQRGLRRAPAESGFDAF